MKQTSCISRSRSRHGSRPSTLSSPWYGVKPRIALSAVVLPAPFGPMSPTMRPSSTRRSTPSSATVVPNLLRSPRASIEAMASALLLFRFRFRAAACAPIQQFFRAQSQPLNSCVNSGPFFIEKFLPLPSQEQVACPRFHVHSQTPPFLNQFLIHQLLIALQDRERIQPVVGRHRAHRGQRIAFLENTVQNHGNHTVAELAVDWLTVVPLT